MARDREEARMPEGRGSTSSAGRSTTVRTAPPSDEIYERYLERAISEINELGDELLGLGDESHVPVLGSGHPLGDVFLLKYAPQHSEIAEGVAFFGRSGNALLKSLERLAVDPTTVYGTNCLKFGTESPQQARPWLTRELHIVQPKIVVAMGERAVQFLNEISFPLADAVDAGQAASLQRFTATIAALVTPDIDDALDEQAAKSLFWNAFKALGPWWADLPPY
jgi:uracil-DNA glycosylase